MFIPLCFRYMYILYCWCIHEDHLLYPSLSLYLWRITSWSKMCFFVTRIESQGVSVWPVWGGPLFHSRNFRNFWCSEIPFQGSHKWSLISPQLVLWVIYFRGGDFYGSWSVCSRGFFLLCSYFFDPFFTNQSNDMSRTGFDHCSSGDRDSRSGWIMILLGKVLASKSSRGGRSKSYPQKMAIMELMSGLDTSLKLTARTWKWMVGRRSFPFGMAYFQVRC